MEDIFKEHLPLTVPHRSAVIGFAIVVEIDQVANAFHRVLFDLGNKSRFHISEVQIGNAVGIHRHLDLIHEGFETCLW